MGNLLVDADVAVNLGTSTDRFPLRVTAGQSTTLTVHGTGLFTGGTLTARDPDFILSPPNYFGTQVSFQLTVPAGEPLGHIDLTFENASGDVAILAGGVEVTNPTPTVAGCVPGSGGRSGGTAVTITGTNFSAGNRIVIGDQIYTDGVNGTTVVDPTTITLTTLATIEGMHDVVVLDDSGLEGRLVSGFTSQNLPMVGTVFPLAGDASGGTVVTITGQDFQSGIVARIDGVTQGTVNYVDSTRITFTTAAGSVGGPYTLELENPDMGIATSVFTYSAGPDPALTGISPAVGGIAGGDTLTITGSNFDANTTVYFGVDPHSGLGGTVAASVALVDPSTLTVETPAHTAGIVNVMVTDSSTSQSDILEASFTFMGPGGGGCHAVPVQGPRGPEDVLAGLWWVLAVLAYLKLRSLRAQPVVRGA